RRHRRDLHAIPSRRSSDLRPVSTGWIYNPGETSVQFRYQYTEAEQSGAWIPWLTVPAGHQVSFQSVHIYRIALQPAPGESEASVDRKSTRLNSSHVKISYA